MLKTWPPQWLLAMARDGHQRIKNLNKLLYQKGIARTKQRTPSLKVVERPGDGFLLQGFIGGKPDDREEPIRLTKFTMQLAVVRAMVARSETATCLVGGTPSPRGPGAEEETYYLLKIKSWKNHSTHLGFVDSETLKSYDAFETACKKKGIIVPFIHLDRQGVKMSFGWMQPYVNREHWSKVIDHCRRGFLEEQKNSAEGPRDEHGRSDCWFYLRPEDFDG